MCRLPIELTLKSEFIPTERKTVPVVASPKGKLISTSQCLGDVVPALVFSHYAMFQGIKLQADEESSWSHMVAYAIIGCALAMFAAGPVLLAAGVMSAIPAGAAAVGGAAIFRYRKELTTALSHLYGCLMSHVSCLMSAPLSATDD